MKYIRTKDGKIFEIIEETENSFTLCSPFDKKMGCHTIMVKRMLGNNEKPTYRLADTIEELCDEFVYYNVYQERYIVLSDFEEAYIHYGTINETPLFGAIWTDKGLIYVAKMNDKGELELI